MRIPKVPKAPEEVRRERTVRDRSNGERKRKQDARRAHGVKNDQRYQHRSSPGP